jgi:hypothetical protein
VPKSSEMMFSSSKGVILGFSLIKTWRRTSMLHKQ